MRHPRRRKRREPLAWEAARQALNGAGDFECPTCEQSVGPGETCACQPLPDEREAR